MVHWYAVRTATRREYDANQALYEAGFPFYVPSDTHDRKLKGLVEVLTRPRYPGYGFVQCAPDQVAGVRDLRFVHDVLRYVDDDGIPRPMPVPPQVVAELFKAQWEGRFDRRKAEYIPARGDKVKLTEGKWAALGYVYELTSLTSDKRKALLSYRGWKIEDVEVSHLVAA